MKKITAVCLLVVASIITSNTTSAQISALAKTNWSGVAYVPNETNVKFSFGVDTLKLLIADNNLVLETMTYRLSNDTLFLIKVDGTSPCDTYQEGVYRVAVKEKLLTIVPITDPCEVRSAAFSAAGYRRDND